MGTPKTLFDKIWERHVVAENESGEALIYIDRHLYHEGSFHAFNYLNESGRPVRRPDLTLGIADHYVPTLGSEAPDPEIARMIELFEENSTRHGLTNFRLGDPRQGIVHVVGPEQGITLPGITLCCGDSHTSTHGALGAFAFGIGASEVTHVLATQTLWQRRPKTMRITVTGDPGAGVTAKDLILAIICLIGAAGGSGHAIEYAGPAIEALSMSARFTVCNMSIEAGACAGMIAPDETTFAYVKGRPFAPKDAAWEGALAEWRSLPSDEGAVFEREVGLDVAEIVPMVTWGTSPESCAPITGRVPDPAQEPDPERRAAMERALAYMGLAPGMPLAEIPVDRVFIGSCTNARLDDLRAAASVVRGRKARIPAMVVPGSSAVKAAAEREGLDRVFAEAGFEWRASGCSMCVGINGDTLGAGERSVSTTNRNFVGRQGKGSRTHLVSPAMAAAAALTGRLTDVRELGSLD